MMNLALGILIAAIGQVDTDIIISGGLVHDGSGTPAKRGDIGIKGDRIVAIGEFKSIGNPRRLDAAGMVVSPGFIDLHTHSDYPLQNKPTNANLNYLLQGVTTVVTGNCGSGPVDTANFYAQLKRAGISTNVAHQVPHNDVRRVVMGNVNREPTAEEISKMEALVDRAMRDGAWGLSTGLIYNPGTYSKTPELIALARIASHQGGFYASHIRDEGAGVMAAVEEAITIGSEAKLPVHISHIKVTGRSQWGKAGDVAMRIAAARKEGKKITADQYPYTASSTSLTATVIPARFREGERAELVRRLTDSGTGPLIREAISQAMGRKDAGADIRIARYAPKPSWSSKSIAEIANITGKSPVDVVVEIERNGGAQIINFGMNEEDMKLFMRLDFVATASDGGAMVPDTLTSPHPRSYGTFARKISFFANQEKVISLEQAIRSCTGLPADILGVKDRGYLKLGHKADVVVFDPSRYRDLATYDKPHQYAQGTVYVLVNGIVAVENGKANGKLPGRPLVHDAAGVR